MFHIFKRKLDPPKTLTFNLPAIGKVAGASDSVYGQIQCAGRMIELSVFPTEEGFESSLRTAVSVAEKIALLADIGRKLVIANSLVGYNNQWRFGETVLVSGATESFERPSLTASEFSAKLHLTAVEVSSEQVISLMFECVYMFWGHGFSVTNFDGLQFKDVRIELI